MRKMIAIGSALVMVLMGLVAIAPSAFSDTYTLWAGQNIEAGSIIITHDADNVYITFVTIAGWEITTTHVYVGKTDPAGGDALSSAPGQFPYSAVHNPTIIEYTYTIALTDIDSYDMPKGQKWVADTNPGVALDQTIYIATHAEAQKEIGTDGEGNPIYQEESAWADGDEFGKGWAMYNSYLLDSTQFGLELIQKDTTTWTRLPDGVSGTLKYNPEGSEFQFEFYAEGLADGDYNLMYYADGVNWLQSAKFIASGTSTGGILDFSGSVELNMDLPRPADANYPTGAKIWLIPSGDFLYEDANGFGWINNAHWDDYLWEHHLITYDDTDIP
jgi:hypothetical protein